MRNHDGLPSNIVKAGHFLINSLNISPFRRKLLIFLKPDYIMHSQKCGIAYVMVPEKPIGTACKEVVSKAQ